MISPGAESIGPTMFDLVRETQEAQNVERSLLNQLLELDRDRTIVSKAVGKSPATGFDFTFPIYRVPFGFELVITRINIEAASVNSVFSPANPLTTNNASQAAIFEGDVYGMGNPPSSGIGVRGGGSTLYFIPEPFDANGPMAPLLITNGQEEAALVKGGTTVSFWGSLPLLQNITFWIRLQGIQRVI